MTPEVGEVVAITTTASEPQLLVTNVEADAVRGVLLADLASETLHRLEHTAGDRQRRRQLATAEQASADPDQQEDAETLPEGLEPSSSPLDFFANCRETKRKELFVERSNRQNTYARSKSRSAGRSSPPNGPTGVARSSRRQTSQPP